MTNVRAIVRVGEPIGLGEIIHWRPLEGDVVYIEDENKIGAVLIRLDEQLAWENQRARYLIARPRYVGSVISDLKKGVKIVCGFDALDSKGPDVRDIATAQKVSIEFGFLGDLELE